MKVLLLSDTSITSEKANLIQTLHMCFAFAEENQEVILYLPDSKLSREKTESLIRQKMGKELNFSIRNYSKLQLFGRLSILGGYFSIKKILKNENFDLCLTRNPLYLDLAVKMKLPVIFESHNSLLNHRNKFLNTFWQKRLLKNAFSPTVKKFVAISKALGDFWREKGVPEEKILVLHDGFDEVSFLNPLTKKEARKQLRIAEDRQTVVYTGSLYDDRGIQTILRLAKQFPDVSFLIVGGPEAKKQFYSRLLGSEKISNVLMIGSVWHAEVPKYLFAADILLMIWTDKVKTINFCSPLKVFEYMASGRAIVGHGFPTIREVLEDGKTAYLANPKQFDELVSRLQIALETNTDEIPKRARELAFQNYSWKNRASNILVSLRERSVSDKLITVKQEAI